VLEYCIGRDWAAATTGPQPIRVWGGATLAAGCCLPLAAASLTLMGCPQPIRVRVGGGAAPSVAASPSRCTPGAAGPRGGPPPYK
jgi:hypothetical protein